MKVDEIRDAYRRYAPVYDAVFGPILHPARKLIVRGLKCRPGSSILEVGVGTGLSLPLYPKNVKVTGIDISGEMLRKARNRVRIHGISQVKDVLQMDAEKMSFPDSSFDIVVAMYVVSVAENPARLVDEMRRVCKPGGDIFIVNHFLSRNRIMGSLERLMSPFSKLTGFHPNLNLEEFLEDTQLEVVQISSANLFGYWKVVRCRNAMDKAMVA